MTTSRVPRGAGRACGAAVLALCALGAAGCASRGLGVRLDAGTTGPDPRPRRRSFAARPAVRRHRQRCAAGSRRKCRSRRGARPSSPGCYRPLLNRTTAPLTYVAGHTGTAAEVFASGTANCLGFSQLFVALARELDLPVYLLRVSDLQSFEREGDLIVASAHVTAAFGTPDRRRILDFAQRPVSAYRWVEEISDLTAVALYYSNRGAEELRDGRTDSWAWSCCASRCGSTRSSPRPGSTWASQSAARATSSPRRPPIARRSKWIPPRSPAYQNLSALLRLIGREQEAEELLGARRPGRETAIRSATSPWAT